MKKIISMGIASAVLALTAIAASADMAASVVEEKAVADGTVTVEVKTTVDVEDFGFNILAGGLEVVSVSVNEDNTAAAAQEDGSYNITGASMKGWKAGETVATITYTVTAEVGDTVAVALSGMKGYEDVVFTPFEAMTVVEAGQPGQPVQPDQPDNPGTGVALAVVPAVLAGAAVVVAKKRK